MHAQNHTSIRNFFWCCAYCDLHLKICNREKMFSSRFSPSTRTFADAVRNSRSPSPADDGAAPVDAAAASPDVPRVAIFEANTKDFERDVEFKGRTYAIEGAVTKYGDFLLVANSLGALASGNDKTVPDFKRIGGKLISRLSSRLNSLQHNNIQLNRHLKVIFHMLSMCFLCASICFPRAFHVFSPAFHVLLCPSICFPYVFHVLSVFLIVSFAGPTFAARL